MATKQAAKGAWRTQKDSTHSSDIPTSSLKGHRNFPAFKKVCYSHIGTKNSKTVAKSSEKSRLWPLYSHNIMTICGHFHFPWKILKEEKRGILKCHQGEPTSRDRKFLLQFTDLTFSELKYDIPAAEMQTSRLLIIFIGDPTFIPKTFYHLIAVFYRHLWRFVDTHHRKFSSTERRHGCTRSNVQRNRTQATPSTVADRTLIARLLFWVELVVCSIFSVVCSLVLLIYELCVCRIRSSLPDIELL